MTYATTYHIGHDTPAQRAKATQVAPTVKRVRRMDAKNKRCGGSPKGQTTVRTDCHVADGFLRTAFLPKLAETETVQACRKNKKTEHDFYQSLSRLAGYYGIETMRSKDYGYPYNIALALWYTKAQLKDKVRDWEEIRLIKDSSKTYFMSEERYDTSSTLFYIPVVPLYRMLRNPKRKHTARLLLSVCSYLYHIADVPYYRQEDSYLYWQYDMIKEWITSDDETEESAMYLSELEQAEWIGEHMEQKLFNRANLLFFKERLNGFTCRDTLDLDAMNMAMEAFALYEQYPERTIFANARPNGQVDEDETDGMVTMDRYVSFCADGKGWLNENLLQCINTELQEYTLMEEPALIRCFDGSEITDNTLCFENRLFALMEELIYILNNF
ncbi:hypothetical protein [Pedobacter insulae]|uniref:Uncharacterized protein n=1 Tax=Pedobacter insulae TaxID=414048 RepID=A0A1I2ZI37_9SPHI|nr:hypothetical protein [Pedobacter insulae]SFH37400.1 hypothetical protein SAMN04489864_11041 [Pedobacter insulae]